MSQVGIRRGSLHTDSIYLKPRLAQATDVMAIKSCSVLTVQERVILCFQIEVGLKKPTHLISESVGAQLSTILAYVISTSFNTNPSL